MASIFTKIINGEIPSIKVSENETCRAFMDIHPLKMGHVLVVPKVEVDEIYHLEDKDLTDLTLFAKTISIAIKKTFNKRVGIVVIGLEVPHAHIHLIPMDSESDLNFHNPKLKLTPEELTDIADRIKSNL